MKTLLAFLKIMWKYQQPPKGRTGLSTPWALPLIILISMGPSGPSGKALGILGKRGSDRWRRFVDVQNALFRAHFLIARVLNGNLSFKIDMNTILEDVPPF
jgi:hypothetical protein